MERINASIITIGDELLIGQVVDTNSAWMAQELNKSGIWLRRRLSIGDVKEEIITALEEESRQASVILITGGLGPTADDITKPVLAEYFGARLVMHEESLRRVTQIFERLNRPMIERNRKQAELPDTCTVIPNDRGTAPGMWFEKNGKIFVSMPGVPHEMKGMVTHYVLPMLQQHFELPFIDHRTLLTSGIGESFLAEQIADWEANLPAHIKLAYLPNYGTVRLRITGMDTDKGRLKKDLDEAFSKLIVLVKDWLVTAEDISLPEVVGKLLLEKQETLSTAESCTGGYLAHLITAVPGSSAYYKGSVISYANDVKNQVLQVSEETLQTAGAVSEETVRQMVKGVLAVTGTDYAIATSGIMGPSGGSTEKPVGTVWIAVGNRDNVVAEKFTLRFDRTRNIEITAGFALNMMQRFLRQQS
ncbi:MAG: competence/damage-inducible protein A [Chitinophagaceae bacterium]|nr:competence/damage-inducible protein A [Chitinophagaceae bacterium]MCW5928670.1 competence/damage-inducible protein A [Chitinophagaceae bacterium]